MHTSINIVHDRGTHLNTTIDLREVFDLSFSYPSVCSGHQFWLTAELDRRLVRTFDEVKLDGDSLLIDYTADYDLKFYVQNYYP